MPIQKILLVDDSKTELHVLSELLTKRGYQVRTAENGEDALKRLQEDRADLILMDVQMPNMDGPTATRTIRQRETDQGLVRTPIIALTANAMVEQVESYLAAGMDAVVSKPVDLKLLLTTISDVMSAKT